MMYYASYSMYCASSIMYLSTFVINYPSDKPCIMYYELCKFHLHPQPCHHHQVNNYVLHQHASCIMVQVLHYVSCIIHHISSIELQPSFIIYHPLSTIYHLSSIMCILSSIIYHPSSIIFHLQSIKFHPTSIKITHSCSATLNHLCYNTN